MWSSIETVEEKLGRLAIKTRMRTRQLFTTKHDDVQACGKMSRCLTNQSKLYKSLCRGRAQHS